MMVGRNVRRNRSRGNVIWVDAAATGNNDGTTPADAYTDYTNALTDDDVATKRIQVIGATYKPDGASPGDRTLFFSPPDGSKTYCGFTGPERRLQSRRPGTNSCIFSGDIGATDNDRSYHVFGWTTNPNFLVDGAVIEDGQADGADVHQSGGGFAGYGTAPRFVNCTIQNCVAVQGGAVGVVSLDASDFYLYNCTVKDCLSAAGAGGVYVIDGGLVTIRGTIDNCNSGGASGLGGGGAATYGNWTILGTTIKNCEAGAMGGAGVVEGNLVVNDALLLNNTADQGGVFRVNSSGSITARHITAAGNTTIGETDFNFCVDEGADITITDSILYDNDGGLLSATAVKDITYTDVEGGHVGEGNINADPLFVGGGDYSLQAGSPCIGTASDGSNMGAI